MRALIYIVVFLVLFVLYVRYLEYKSLFYPIKDVLVTPTSIGLSYENIYFKTRTGLVLNGWLVEGVPQSKAVMLFFHGNAGNIGDRLTKLKYFSQMGVNVFIILYREKSLIRKKLFPMGFPWGARLLLIWRLTEKYVD